MDDYSPSSDETSAVLNPEGRFYTQIKRTLDEDYEDNYWLEDAIFMERNSRDFASRIERINRNAEAICDILKAATIGQYFRRARCHKEDQPGLISALNCLVAEIISHKLDFLGIPQTFSSLIANLHHLLLI